MLAGTKAMDVLRLVNPMAKKCPLGGYVLYLDCLECEEKVCKGGKKVADVKENVIEWINGQDTIAVTLHQGRYITKVERLAKKFPKQVKILKHNRDGSIFAKLPLKALKLSLTNKAEMSEEQRQKVRERFAKAKKKEREDEGWEDWNEEDWEE